ncbi:MAG: ATP synthase subunit I [Anaerovoracaceae bacterium]
MTKSTLMMLKRVILGDGVVLLLSIVILMIFFREYALALIIGIIIALVNFLINAIITEYAMKSSKGKILILLGTIGRIAIAAVMALVLYDNDMKNIVAYLIGYSLHYVSLIISMATQKNKR